MKNEKLNTSDSATPINTKWDSLAESESPLTRSEVIKLTGASASKVRKEFIKLREEGEEISSITIGEKRIVEAITQEQFEKIRDRLTPLQLPPDGAITIDQLATDLHVYPDTIRRRIAPEIGIRLDKYRNQSEYTKGGATIYITPDQQTAIRDYLTNRHGEYISDGFVPVVDVAKELGLYGAEPIFDYFNNKNECLEEYRQKGIRTRCLSEKQYNEIMDYYRSKNEDIQQIPDDSYKTVQQFADEIGAAINTIRDRFGVCSSEVKKYRYDDRLAPAYCLSKVQQQEIMEDLEKSNQGVSKAELTIGYYLQKNNFNFEHSFRPVWMKNPNTDRNLEIDYYVDPPGIGIEYDGSFFHQDIERDLLKDDIAKQSNIRIIHVREFGCPKAPESMLHIDRLIKNNKSDFSNTIKKMLKMLGINSPDVDVERDEKDIFGFIQNLARRKTLDSHLDNTA